MSILNFYDWHFLSEYEKLLYLIIELFNENSFMESIPALGMVLPGSEYDTTQDNFEYMVPRFSKSTRNDWN